jgi:Predicted AAA-ATPase/PD-(D/E)XK nuclease superfamily
VTKSVYLCLFKKIKQGKMSNRNYPTIHYFPTIISSGSIYVDKTKFIEQLLLNTAKPSFFLSRPRRFGKSMLLSTLEHVFLGEKELFKGLYIYDKIEWDRHPVIRISMDKIRFSTLGLETALEKAIEKASESYDIHLTQKDSGLAFEELIEKLHEKYEKKVVVLIDEYDKPIIHYLEKDGTKQAEANRDTLKAFYGILKDNGEHLRFTFITGVSKFSKVSIFSDLNYITDLTLDTRFATICGFTDAEIRQYCDTGLEDLALKEGKSVEEIMAKIKYWYDGFSWNAVDFVYNPYSTMLLMENQAFKHYWFSSGTPTFLVKLINTDYKYNFDNVTVSEDDYDWHDLTNLDYTSIMLQTGYLTFKEDLGDGYFKANYPNKEVEKAFSKMLLEGYTNRFPSQITKTVYDIEQCLIKHDLEGMIKIVEEMFKSLPPQFFSKEYETTDKQGNIIKVSKAVNESFYHAIIYLIFNILGVRMDAEAAAGEGRIDAVVETKTHIYIFEFKKDRKAQAAIDQIIKNNYPQKYALSKKEIYLVGISFTLQKRGISDKIITPFPLPLKLPPQ